MINETFSSKRFWNYFQYDLKQLWNNNGKAAVLLGFISVLCYLLWVAGSLVFTGTWNAPGLAARLFFFLFGGIFLVFYQTRTYGYLTQKQAGASWLMIPASSLEKFLSMVLLSVVLVPLAYVCSYMILDAVIALLDPTAGDAILSKLGTISGEISNALSAASEEGFQFNLSVLAVPVFLQLIADMLYFLLCGISFKKWKIVGGIAVLMGISMVITPIFSSFAIHTWAPMLSQYGTGDDPTLLMNFLNSVLNWGTVLDALMVLGLAAGVFYRIRTLKH